MLGINPHKIAAGISCHLTDCRIREKHEYADHRLAALHFLLNFRKSFIHNAQFLSGLSKLRLCCTHPEKQNRALT
jgi:hypothetical protein